MTKLNQIIAVEKGVKARTQSAITDVYHRLQKRHLFDGLTRTYRPIDDDGERFPNETQIVQLRVSTLLDEVASATTRLFDVVATKDAANTRAAADVVVDNHVILRAVPITTLLFLEKQLTDLHSLVSKVPTHDPAQQWEFDPGPGLYRAAAVETHKSKKIPRNHVKAAATDKHPAQVDVFTEDVIVGYWTKTDITGALPANVLRQLLERIRTLQDAVKVAREAANSIEIEDVKIGRAIFDYLLGE